MMQPPRARRPAARPTLRALSLGLLALPVIAQALPDTVERARTEEAQGVEAGEVATPNPPPPTWQPPVNPLFDNGPLINNPGGGVGGADESMVQESTLGMSTLGFGNQRRFEQRIADDFIVPPRTFWQIDRITFFQYQTGSTLDSTFTALNYRIWEGFPRAPGSRVVFGDTFTNRIVSAPWSGIFRVREPISGTASDRPIMALETAASVLLYPGTYWIDWQADGTLVSGPWVPPVTIPGLSETGNAIQSATDGNTWQPATDGGTGDPQGLPFIIEGSAGNLEAIPALSPWGQLLLAALVAGLGWRRLSR